TERDSGVADRGGGGAVRAAAPPPLATAMMRGRRVASLHRAGAANGWPPLTAPSGQREGQRGPHLARIVPSIDPCAVPEVDGEVVSPALDGASHEPHARVIVSEREGRRLFAGAEGHRGQHVAHLERPAADRVFVPKAELPVDVPAPALDRAVVE